MDRDYERRRGTLSNGHHGRVSDDDDVIMMPNFRSICLTTEPTIRNVPSDRNNSNLGNKIGTESNMFVMEVGKSQQHFKTEASPNFVGCCGGGGSIDKHGWTTTPNSSNNQLIIFHRKSPFQPISKYNMELPTKEHVEKVMMTQLPFIFHKLSLHVMYSNSPVTASCIATTANSDGSNNGLLEFKVTISESHNCSNKKRDSNKKYLLEIDPISGDTIAFHSFYANAILELLNNYSDKQRMATVHQTSTIISNKRWNMDSNETMLNHQEIFRSLLSQSNSNSLSSLYDTKQNNEFIDVVATVDDLLSSTRYDAVSNGLQLLLQLTNVNHCGYETANKVSHILLFGGKGDNDTFNSRSDELKLHETFLFWIQKIMSSIGFDNDDDDDDDDDVVILSRDRIWTVMSILTQALHLLNPMDDITTFLVRVSDNGRSEYDLIDYLMDYVASASSDPHMAYLATHMLAVFYTRAGKVDVQMKIRDCTAMIHNAYWFGSYHHADLELATTRLLTELGSTPTLGVSSHVVKVTV